MTKMSLFLAVALLAVVAVSSQAGPMLQIERSSLIAASSTTGDLPIDDLLGDQGKVLAHERASQPEWTTQASLSTREGEDGPTNPVPEPASLLLLGVGLAGLAAKQRRRLLSRGGDVK